MVGITRALGEAQEIPWQAPQILSGSDKFELNEGSAYEIEFTVDPLDDVTIFRNGARVIEIGGSARPNTLRIYDRRPLGAPAITYTFRAAQLTIVVQYKTTPILNIAADQIEQAVSAARFLDAITGQDGEPLADMVQELADVKVIEPPDEKEQNDRIRKSIFDKKTLKKAIKAAQKLKESIDREQIGGGSGP